jgi:hypothetical protein
LVCLSPLLPCIVASHTRISNPVPHQLAQIHQQIHPAVAITPIIIMRCRIPTALPLPDIFIDTLDVQYNPAAQTYTATIKVRNYNDDDAKNAILVVTLPIESRLISVDPGPFSKSWSQCGAVVKVCLGELYVCGNPCKDNPEDTCQRTVKVTVSKIRNIHYQDFESISAFVYSSTPDICPNNNFKVWFKKTGRCSAGPCPHQ